ncbi:MAG: VTT domain-containing protein [Planctomycetota bacterium]
MNGMNKSGELAHAGRTSASVKHDVGNRDVHGNWIVTVVRWLSILLIVAALLTILRSLPIGQAMEAMTGWIAGLGIWGPVVLALVYVVATVLFVPGTILTLAGGALFGLVVGTITVSIASTLGAAMAFLIGRYVARDKVAAMASRSRKFGAIDRAIDEGGWKIVAMLRLSPAIPFNLQNYLYGLTPIRFWTCVVTSWLAMLPGTFLYVYLGHVTAAAVGADRERTTAEWVMLAVGLLATAAVTVYITWLARRKLQEQMKETAESSKASPNANDGDQRDQHGAPPLRSTIILAAVAMVMACAAGYVYANSKTMERWLGGLFGPPRVELKEAYAENAAGPAFDHSAFDSLLHEHVDPDGWVDYQGLKKDEAKLDAYVDAVAAAPFDAMGRNDKLALLINAYNAFTLKLIVERLPLDSIMDIPAAERWDAVRWNVGGQVWSLGQIEHEQIRPKFVEPRVHFALVCAAVGCPPLRSEAYDATRLDEQLAKQTEYVHRHATWFEFDARANVVRLTKLYDWYGDDFVQVAGSTTEFAARYSPDLKQALEAGSPPVIEWLPYDWELNSVANKQPR